MSGTVETTTVGNVSIRVVTTKDWPREIQRTIKDGLKQMGTEILNEAVQNAPILTGALRASGTVTQEGGMIRVRFGSDEVPYARMRHFVNHLHPDTTYYLQRAGDQLTAHSEEFFKSGEL